MPIRIVIICLLTFGFILGLRSSRAQFSYPTGDDEGQNLPESVPTDLLEPQIAPRETAADRLARIFNRDLRRIENQQVELEAELEGIPQTAIESFLPRAFGYHSGIGRSRPKWIQIDLGERVSPQAFALFPVTVQVKGETIFGYGFPRAFRVDMSDDPDFKSYETVFDGRIEEESGSRRWPFFRKISGFTGRYIRVTATALWRPQGDHRGEQRFALSEIMVFKDERNIAINCPVKARDSSEAGNRWSRRFINDGITAFGIPHGDEESPTLGYRGRTESSVKSSWVQVDLEESMPIQEVRIILADYLPTVPDPAVRFPYPIAVEASDYPDMRQSEQLARITPREIYEIGNNFLIIPVTDGYGRYVRFTVSHPKPGPMNFSLAEVQIFSDYRNVALGKSVIGSHPDESGDASPRFLVDGYSSRKVLIDYQGWVSNIGNRIEKVREWKELEESRLVLVDRTFTRGVISLLTGLFGGLSLALVIYAQGRVKQRKELEALRQRIASDLHDDIGSNLSSIALLAELGKTEAGEPDLVTEELSEIKTTADKTIESMRDIVWLIRPGEETWKQMMTRFRETASKLLRTHDYTFIEDGHMPDDRLPLEFKRDFFLIYKEVLNNIVRHAKANRVKIAVQTAKGRLALKIEDDGIGFDKLDTQFREGNGLRNLRMRAAAIGADLDISSVLNEGTTVTLSAKLK